MLRTDEILSTIEMLHAEHLDVRAVTLALNIDDCAAPSVDHVCRKLKNKILGRASRLVETCDRVGAKYGIPVVNKRLAISPASTILAGHGHAAAVQVARTLDAAAAECGVDFVGGFTALVHKGITPADAVVMNALPEVLSQTKQVCASVNVASRKAGINMDAVHEMGHVLLKIAHATADRQGFGCAKLVIFANIPEDNPFMAGAYMGAGEPEAAVNIGVSGPGVVCSALRRRLAREPKLTLGDLAEEIKITSFRVTRVGELIGREVAAELGVAFGIVDLSLAPTPTVGDSVGEILKTLGISRIGAPGSTEVPLGELGFDATSLAAFAERLVEWSGFELSTPFLSEHPTITALAGYLARAQRSASSPLSPWASARGEGVTGLADRSLENAPDLRDLAYTLQMGREPLEERLAVLVSNVAEAVEVLNRFHAGDREITGLYRGNARKDRAGVPAHDATVVADLLHRRVLTELARLWVAGLEVDWAPLYEGDHPSRLSLPTYPFARERYWLPQRVGRVSQRQDAIPVVALHPLLQRNTSDFFEVRFSSSFTGQEFFLADHRMLGQRILPGVAYLEMAHAAVASAHGGPTIGMQLRNVVWVRPFVAVEAPGTPAETEHVGPNQLHIGLSRAEDGTVNYEIYGAPERSGDQPPLYGQGCAMVAAPVDGAETPTLDLTILRQQCSQRLLSADECYETFKVLGLEYGPGLRGLETLYVGSDRVLARLRLPEAVAHTQDKYVLHPSLMDAALQSAIGLMHTAHSADATQTIAGIGARPALPFALDALEIFARCPPATWASVRYSDSKGPGDRLPKLDIDLCDDQGYRCVSFRGLSCRVESDAPARCSGFGTLLMAPVWGEPDRAEAVSSPTFSRHVVIFCEPDDLSREELAARLAGTDVTYLVSNALETGIAARFQTHMRLVFREVQGILRARPQAPVLVQVVVPVKVEEQRLFGAIAAFLKTAHLENPNLTGQVIEVRENFTTWGDGLVGKLQENRQRSCDSHVLYHQGTRLVATWERLGTLPGEVAQEALLLPWRDDGVYLITGGAGGLGLLFAVEIARRARRATIILVGRSPLAGERLDRFSGIQARSPQATIDYRRVDVTHAEMVNELVQGIRRTFGNLHGIIHGAGVLRDKFLLKKGLEEVHAVLAPKVAGLVNLDQASQDCDLDYLVLCSSGSAAEGNVGQADYAAANAFMDAYAVYRNQLAENGQRRGRTLSVNWPLWQQGGMQVDQQTEDLLLHRMGMTPMTTDAAFRALYQALASGRDQIWLLEGDLERLQALFKPSACRDVSTGSPEPTGSRIKLPLPLGELSGVGFSSPRPLGEGEGEGGMVSSHKTPHPRPLPEGEGEMTQGQCRVSKNLPL